VRESLFILIKQSLGGYKFSQNKSLENDNLSTQFPPKILQEKHWCQKNSQKQLLANEIFLFRQIKFLAPINFANVEIWQMKFCLLSFIQILS